MWRILEIMTEWFEVRDPVIDDLIAKNAARWRGGMDRPDWEQFDRIGERRWQETVRAERRLRSVGAVKIIERFRMERIG